MIHVGVLDSGIDGRARECVAACREFSRIAAPEPEVAAQTPDLLGHGTAIAEAILEMASTVRLLDARIFSDRLVCTPAQAAAGIDWLSEAGARVINMSFGLRDDREVLRSACERALGRGIVLVAATPARGGPVFPAAYPGVIRATGDARCALGEISCLETAQADFGACVRSSRRWVAGASIGCAHLAGAVARLLCERPGAGAEELREALRTAAAYHGPERRLH